MNHCTIAYTFYDLDFRVRRYAETVAHQGNRADAITLQHTMQTENTVLENVNVLRIKKRVREEKGIFQYLFRLIGFLFRSGTIAALRHLRYRYDIVHVHNVPDFLVFAALIPKLLGAKVILDIHDIMPEFYAQKFGVSVNAPVVRLLKLVERISVRFADYVIVANDLWRQKIISRDKVSPAKCIALLNYPAPKFFEGISCDIKKPGLRLIYPGHLSVHHGIDIAIRAMSMVRQEVPEVQFDIYASSSLRQFRQSLDSLIVQLGLGDVVHFHPSVGLREIAQKYRNVTIGLVPKRGGVFASEAFSTKIFDFLSAGVPIVASRTSVDEYYFDDSLIAFFEPENHEDLARRIVELYRNPAKRIAMSQKGKLFIKQNNWEIKKQVYVDVVKELLG